MESLLSPFVGELGNNSATNIDYMKPIWPVLAKGNLNSVIAGISWAQVEPEEGKFNFDIVGAVIDDARKNNIKLIFIWFASWKKWEVQLCSRLGKNETIKGFPAFK